MKQGPSRSYSGPTKVEPKPRAVNPAGVAQIGMAQARMAVVEPIYAGKGYKAPTGGSQVHHRGSQGKHR